MPRHHRAPMVHQWNLNILGTQYLVNQESSDDVTIVGNATERRALPARESAVARFTNFELIGTG